MSSLFLCGMDSANLQGVLPVPFLISPIFLGALQSSVFSKSIDPMKNFSCWLFLVVLFCATSVEAQPSAVSATSLGQSAPPALAARSWLLIDLPSGQVLAAEKQDERLEPASLTKLMTAYLTFSALRQNALQLQQPLQVSEKAWRTEGSKMFIKVGAAVPVEDLIKGMIVQSGNDACVTLAEGIAGSEENFAKMMNQEAKRLGMNATQFQNATGLPDAAHYTTARDLSLLATALIRDFPEEYKRYYAIKDYRYNNITQPNRNRLLWQDASVDGMKTGYTKAAGYCLIASARRENRRLLSVVLGAASEKLRISESQKLLSWGFSAYENVSPFEKGVVMADFPVWKGTQKTVVAGFSEDFSVAVPRGMADKLQLQFSPIKALIAPVVAGQQVGNLKITLDGKPYLDYPVTAREDIELGGFFRRFWDSIRLWFN